MAVAGVTVVANVALILVVQRRSSACSTLALLVLIVAVWRPRRAAARSRLQRESFDHQRELNSRAFQLIGHVGKLRASAAEERAFACWAEAFVEQPRGDLRRAA